ncbi:zinc-binding dehydrogenase [Nocardioides sp. NPDC127514]|uniref:zinc-binding dehydrogenase n=1 Tax=unclassified Nocardioides TaxID=2615069 RepID=UPI00332D8B67
MPQSRADLEAITALVTSDVVTPVIDSTFPLSEALAAYARLASGDNQGKIVVTMR